MISKTPPIVYFSVMKAVATAVVTAYGRHFDLVMDKNPDLKHTNVGIYEATLAKFVRRPVSRKAVKIAVMREPLSWALSWYRYRTRPELTGAPNSTSAVSAEAFIRSCMLDDPPAYARIGSQYRFLTSRAGGLGVDRLFRYEEIDGLFDFLNAAFGVDLTPPVVNASPKREIAVSPEVVAAYQAKMAPECAYYRRASRNGEIDG